MKPCRLSAHPSAPFLGALLGMLLAVLLSCAGPRRGPATDRGSPRPPATTVPGVEGWGSGSHARLTGTLSPSEIRALRDQVLTGAPEQRREAHGRLVVNNLIAIIENTSEVAAATRVKHLSTHATGDSSKDFWFPVEVRPYRRVSDGEGEKMVWEEIKDHTCLQDIADAIRGAAMPVSRIHPLSGETVVDRPYANRGPLRFWTLSDAANIPLGLVDEDKIEMVSGFLKDDTRYGLGTTDAAFATLLVTVGVTTDNFLRIWVHERPLQWNEDQTRLVGNGNYIRSIGNIQTDPVRLDQLCGAASASPSVRVADTAAEPFQAQVEIQLTRNGETRAVPMNTPLCIGDHVELYAQTSHDAYLYITARDDTDDERLLFPLAEHGQSATIPAGRTRVGFGFAIEGPPGEDELFFFLSRTQPDESRLFRSGRSIREQLEPLAVRSRSWVPLQAPDIHPSPAAVRSDGPYADQARFRVLPAGHADCRRSR